MVNVEARLKVKGKNFEIIVDVDKAIQMKKGMPVNIENVLSIDEIFSDHKKGLKVSSADLQTAFGTSDVRAVAEKIVKQGEILLPAEYRKKEQETRVRQMIDFLVRNAIDPITGNPHTETRIMAAIEQAGINIENKPIEQQVTKVLSKLKEIMPIKIETKKLRVVIPAVHTGRAYGVIQEYKESENWLSNGDLACIIHIPAGLEMDFYDKLNGVTHGSAVVEEVKEK